MRLETITPGQNLSHNGRQPRSVGPGPKGPRRGLKATWGRRESKSAPAGEAAAKPRRRVDRCRELPHHNSLPLDVQLVESQLVGKRHLGNSAAARGRELRLRERRRPTRDPNAWKMPRASRAPPPRPSPRPFPAAAPGSPRKATAIGRHPKAPERCYCSEALSVCKGTGGTCGFHLSRPARREPLGTFETRDENIEAQIDQEALSTTDLKQHQRCKDLKWERA
ncbi:uncharacterized protein LOC123615575 [Camelus bactrianus]|uniref:Uncharacterized protein LOC123615575 n=1 Tax=Camelus bactrianus TaxID=9837 RepID=A0AC58PYI2_CAMBA